MFNLRLKLYYQFTQQGKEVFSIQELRKKIDAYLNSGNAPRDLINLSTTRLIKELTEQDGIIQKLDREGDQYLFLHRTFQEIDIYRKDIFPVARTLAIRFSQEKLLFIPVYPRLVRSQEDIST